ncbi:TPA: molybdate ABC transporter substrate-binding protein [Staphylococcus argenteus]|uniref:molybdate ABC transporter substrate-binding protein n=1 Tax=Staphylococcus argenteus TaxID=985002 RepID=UPI000233FF0C|nr:molybdate ABC transporter substrate-binding protein [Staphylococcus argenteus]MBE2130815.1 molybdate ABC transporter substrate-binding protein [Staphylococcus argenteus]PNY96494.1 molybdate ABC transporter substrate-binding protein [Staphylococcus argenteus]CCE59932.1 putative molybdate-binding lipoprotein precursor [Staphylococcus argenteus]SUJ23674.1 Molybdate-binding protein [Staphylococcus argenteus]HDY9428819.1 molybdate ABC transporter substrate-binding protein [Staphylococcus argente
MKMKHIVAIIMTLCLVLAGCSNSNESKDSKKESADNGKKQEIQIAAAASLTDVTKKLESEFKKEHKNADIKFNYGGSGALRKQIESGAPVDVFMSANTKDVDALKDKNKAHDTYKYAKNTLVLIGDKDSNYKSVKDLKGNDKLALGEVKTVPAGKYAKQYLDNNNLFKDVENKIVYAKDVKQVLNYVEKGNAKQGFVYKTDLYKQNKKIDTVKEIQDIQLKKPITYEAGATSDNKLAKEWMEFLKSDKAKEILKEYHFAA